MTLDDIRKLAEQALDKRGPWCGQCGEAFSTREPQLAAFALSVLEALTKLGDERRTWSAGAIALAIEERLRDR